MPEDGKEKVLGERDFIFSIVRKYINENSNPKNTAIFWSKEKIYEQAPDIQCILSELNAHH